MKYTVKFRSAQGLFNAGPITTVTVEETNEDQARRRARLLYGQLIDIVSVVPKEGR